MVDEGALAQQGAKEALQAVGKTLGRCEQRLKNVDRMLTERSEARKLAVQALSD